MVPEFWFHRHLKVVCRGNQELRVPLCKVPVHMRLAGSWPFVFSHALNKSANALIIYIIPHV